MSHCAGTIRQLVPAKASGAGGYGLYLLTSTEPQRNNVERRLKSSEHRQGAPGDGLPSRARRHSGGRA